MARVVRQTLASRAPALMEYCEQMRYRVLTRARLVAEQSARHEAERSAEIKSGFISMMSHELRTPLNSIIGFSEILSQPKTFLKDSERINYAELINSSGRHLTAVVNSILEMSKIQSGAYEMSFEDKNLVDVLRDVIASIESHAHEKGVMLARKFAATDIVVSIDELRFIQSLTNVVTNAIKFTEGEGTVTISCHVDGQGMAVVTVADTGVGMTQDELDRAITPFGQAGRGLASGAEGPGLGLCIAKELTRLQKGRFGIESSAGNGTKVTFSFRARAGRDTEIGAFDRSLVRTHGHTVGTASDRSRRTMSGIVESDVRP